jgi:hypothetical protein
MARRLRRSLLTVISFGELLARPVIGFAVSAKPRK